MSDDPEDGLNAELTHEKLDKLIELVEALNGRIEALEAMLEAAEPVDAGTPA